MRSKKIKKTEPIELVSILQERTYEGEYEQRQKVIELLTKQNEIVQELLETIKKALPPKLFATDQPISNESVETGEKKKKTNKIQPTSNKIVETIIDNSKAKSSIAPEKVTMISFEKEKEEFEQNVQMVKRIPLGERRPNKKNYTYKCSSCGKDYISSIEIPMTVSKEDGPSDPMTRGYCDVCLRSGKLGSDE